MVFFLFMNFFEIATNPPFLFHNYIEIENTQLISYIEIVSFLFDPQRTYLQLLLKDYFIFAVEKLNVHFNVKKYVTTLFSRSTCLRIFFNKNETFENRTSRYIHCKSN